MTLTQEIRDRHNRKMIANIREHLKTIDHLLNMMSIQDEVQTLEEKAK